MLKLKIVIEEPTEVGAVVFADEGDYLGDTLVKQENGGWCLSGDLKNSKYEFSWDAVVGVYSKLWQVVEPFEEEGSDDENPNGECYDEDSLVIPTEADMLEPDWYEDKEFLVLKNSNEGGSISGSLAFWDSQEEDADPDQQVYDRIDAISDRLIEIEDEKAELLERLYALQSFVTDVINNLPSDHDHDEEVDDE